jgi:enediyne polyketide synthase
MDDKSIGKTANNDGKIARTSIAVIGMGCLYADAKKPLDLWENVLARRQQFRQIPDCRLPLKEYYSANKQEQDKTYGRYAALIDGYSFDWMTRRVPKPAYESTDIVHWMALDVAIQAIEDAGYSRDSIAKDKTGVIIGNTLTGEFTRTNAMRLRWPYINRVFKRVLQEEGLNVDDFVKIEKKFEEAYKSVFAPITEDTLAGGLSNTIAGRVCNYFDFHGGGYTVDGACSSSLLAIITAIKALVDGDMDIALAGGVDVSLDTFELVGFSKTGALTDKKMTVYDEDGSGFIPGEGCGFVVLKRYEDAKRDGDKIYAVVKGWGISSDGKGGITAPTVKGQAMALNRAYEKAGGFPAELHFIEGHGTGTSVGDQIELKTIASVLESSGHILGRSCGVTSFKSIYGHTKAAAGVGAFIKTVAAVNQRVLPPTAGCKNPHAVFGNEGKNIYPVITGEKREDDHKLCAGVSAMGFGGINSHLVIESGESVNKNLCSKIDPGALFVSNQITEIFIFSAKDEEGLKGQINKLREDAIGISFAELADLAAEQKKRLDFEGALRGAVIAEDPDDLQIKLGLFEKTVDESMPKKGNVRADLASGIYLANDVWYQKIGFVFPGQGSQRLGMGKVLLSRFSWARDIAMQVEEVFGIEKNILKKMVPVLERAADKNELAAWFSALSKTDIAQGACVLVSVLWLEYLKKLGIKPDVVAGHSLGELAAFYSAGAFDKDELIAFAALRARAMAEEKEQGQMVSLRCSLGQAQELIEQVKEYVVIANINGPQQIIVSGSEEGIEEISLQAGMKGISVYLLPVSNAFHSELIKEASQKVLKEAKIPEEIDHYYYKLLSGMTGEEVGLEVNLRHYFSDQMISPVRFVDMVHKMGDECDLMLEVGMGTVLSRLIKDILPSGPDCIPIEGKPGDDASFNAGLANVFIRGRNINWEELYKNRLIRDFVPAMKKQFIVNPLEKIVEKEDGEESLTLKPYSVYVPNNEPSSYVSMSDGYVKNEDVSPDLLIAGTEDKDVLEVLLSVAAKRTGFNKDTITPNLRVLDDLNLDSIKSAELVAEVAKQFKVAAKIDPTLFANSTLKEIVGAIAKEAGKSGDETGGEPVVEDQKAESWVRNFVVEYVKKEISEAAGNSGYEYKKIKKTVVVSEVEAAAFLEAYQKRGIDVENVLFSDIIARQGNIIDWSDRHVVVVMPRSGFDVVQFDLNDAIKRLFAIAKNIKKIAELSVVQFCDPVEVCSDMQCVGGKGFLASLHLENPEINVRVIGFMPEAEAADIVSIVLKETGLSEKFISARYDRDFVRFVPQASIYEEEATDQKKIEWNKEDVVMVTGGAKGITAECALAFAKKTGVKTALIGSSSLLEGYLNEDSEILKNLERFEKAGLQAEYYQCDITDYTALLVVVDQIEAKCGHIAGVIHGAGRNVPKLAENVYVEEAHKEVAPKALGAINLFNIFREKELKLFVGFSSIIGITGMHGNSWYAFSNEILGMALDRFSKVSEKTSVVDLAYSVWDEVGMGAKMGSTQQLARMGIGSIPKEDGVSRFLDLTDMDYAKQGRGYKQVVVTAKLGNLDTWPTKTNRKPAADRFLENIVTLEPDVEIVSRVKLNLEHDLYLKDHNFKGSFLFPTVFGLEAMAQAVAHLLGIDSFGALVIENINLERPIVVKPNGDSEIEIRAEVVKEDKELEKNSAEKVTRVKVGITTEQTDFTVDHFSAEFVLGGKAVPEKQELELPQKALDISPKEDLYGWLLFQGPLFQRMGAIYDLNSKEALFTSVRRPGKDVFPGCFSKEKESPFILGDPFFRDSLLQSVQLSIPKDLSLPIYIEKMELLDLDSANNLEIVKSTINDLKEGVYHCAVDAKSWDGKAVEKIVGYQLKILEVRKGFPNADELCLLSLKNENILKSKCQDIKEKLNIEFPNFTVMRYQSLARLAKEERHSLEANLFINTVKKLVVSSDLDVDVDKEAKVIWDSKGKPLLEGQMGHKIGISLAHDDDICFVVAGKKAQGCDIELIKEKEEREWEALLPQGNRAVFLELSKKLGDKDLAGTSVWCAVETMKKAMNSNQVGLEISKIADQAVLFLAKVDDVEKFIVSLPVDFSGQEKRVVSFVVVGDGFGKEVLDAPPVMNGEAIRKDEEIYSYTGRGPQGQEMFAYRFRPLFKQIRSVEKTVTYPVYAELMGQLRELPLMPISDLLIPELESGKWGAVTNVTNLEIIEDVGTMDLIEGRIWISELKGKDGSTMEMEFDWVKIQPSGGFVRVARGHMSATWVYITGHGTVEVMPFPDYLQELMEKMTLRLDSRAYVPNLEIDSREDDFGADIFISEKDPQKLNILNEETFSTTLEDSNIVGNIYFANYFSWQERVLESYLYSVIPEIFNNNDNGMFVCKKMFIKHLRELMPFEKIIVQMSLKKLADYGMILCFDFYKEGLERKKEKLAFGEKKVYWKNSHGKKSRMPQLLIQKILDTINKERHFIKAEDLFKIRK